MFALDSVHPGSSSSLRGSIQLDFLPLLWGMTCLDSPLSALDFLHMGSLMPLRSHICVGSVPPAYGMGWPEFPLPVLDRVHFGSSMLPRSFACSGFLLLPYGHTRLDFFMFVLDLIKVGLVMSAQSFVCLGPAMLVYGLCRLGLPLLALDFAVLNSSLSLKGPSKVRTHVVTLWLCLPRLSPIGFGLYARGEFALLAELCSTGLEPLSLWHELSGVCVLCTGYCPHWLPTFFAQLFVHGIFALDLRPILLGPLFVSP